MKNKIHIGIVGAGNIGSTIYQLLISSDYGYQISIADISEKPHNISEENFTKLKTVVPDHVGIISTVDDYTGNGTQFTEFVKDKSLIINALPYHQNINLYKECLEAKVPYFDLSEDDGLDKWIKTNQMEIQKKPFVMPHCGLAPGLSTVIAYDLLKSLETPHILKIRVGALSQNADNKLRYYSSWSGDGLVNEYLGDCTILKRGRIETVPALSGYEKTTIAGREYECFNTSGGIGSLPHTIRDKYNPDDSIKPSTIYADYKTLRRVGHHDYVDFLFHDLHLDRSSLTAIFKHCIPTTRKDEVILYVSASSTDKEDEVMYYKVFKPTDINGRWFSAIEYTTAIGMVSMVELFVEGKIPQKGYVRQEDVKWKDIVSTKYGSFYKE